MWKSSVGYPIHLHVTNKNQTPQRSKNECQTTLVAVLKVVNPQCSFCSAALYKLIPYPSRIVFPPKSQKSGNFFIIKDSNPIFFRWVKKHPEIPFKSYDRFAFDQLPPTKLPFALWNHLFLWALPLQNAMATKNRNCEPTSVFQYQVDLEIGSACSLDRNHELDHGLLWVHQHLWETNRRVRMFVFWLQNWVRGC